MVIRFLLSLRDVVISVRNTSVLNSLTYVFKIRRTCKINPLPNDRLFLCLSYLFVCNPSFLDDIKVQYLQFMAHMKTPQYRSNLQQLLEQEKVISEQHT